MIGATKSNSLDKAKIVGVSILLLFQNTQFSAFTAEVNSQSEPVKIEDKLDENEHDYVQQVNNLSKEIVLKGIELNRFSLKYRLENDKESKWKNLRYAAGQEAGVSSLLASEIILLSETGSNLNTPGRISPNVIKGAFTTGLVGASINGSSSLFELSSNFRKWRRNKKSGFDHKQANQYFAKKLNELHQLISKRDKLVNSKPEHSAYKILDTEGKALKALVDLYVVEYASFQANLYGEQAFQNIFYPLNIITNSTLAAAIILGLRGVDHHHADGPSGILVTIAGAIAAVAPSISNQRQKLVKKHAFGKLIKHLNDQEWIQYSEEEQSEIKRCIEEADITRLRDAQERLEVLYRKSDPALRNQLGMITKRITIYAETSEQFNEVLGSETRRIAHLSKAYVEDSITGPVVGGGFMTQGILSTVAFYKHSAHPINARAERHKNGLIFAGSLVGTTSSAIGATSNLLFFEKNRRYMKRLHEKKHLIEDRIATRLDRLNELEKFIKNTNDLVF